MLSVDLLPVNNHKLLWVFGDVGMCASASIFRVDSHSTKAGDNESAISNCAVPRLQPAATAPVQVHPANWK